MKNCDFEYYYFDYFIFITVILSITFAVTIYGVTTWVVVKPFRTLKMFLFLNICFVTLLSYFFTLIDLMLHGYVMFFSFVGKYFEIVYAFWMIIMCVGFFKVTVMERPFACSYCTCACLAWGVPFCAVTLAVILFCFTTFFDYFYVFVLLFLLYCVLALIFTPILWKLIKSIRKKSPKIHLFNRVELIVLLGLAVGALPYACLVFGQHSCEYRHDMYPECFVIECIQLTPVIVIYIWILAAQSNIILWKDYYENKSRKNLDNIRLNNYSLRNETPSENEGRENDQLQNNTVS